MWRRVGVQGRGLRVSAMWLWSPGITVVWPVRRKRSSVSAGLSRSPGSRHDRVCARKPVVRSRASYRGTRRVARGGVPRVCRSGGRRLRRWCAFRASPIERGGRPGASRSVPGHLPCGAAPRVEELWVAGCRWTAPDGDGKAGLDHDAEQTEALDARGGRVRGRRTRLTPLEAVPSRGVESRNPRLAGPSRHARRSAPKNAANWAGPANRSSRRYPAITTTHSPLGRARRQRTIGQAERGRCWGTGVAPALADAEPSFVRGTRRGFLAINDEGVWAVAACRGAQ